MHPRIYFLIINPIKSFINTNFTLILKTTIITWKRPLPFRIGKLSRLCCGNSFRREVKFISCLSLSYRIYDSYDPRKSQSDFLHNHQIKMIIPVRCFSCGKPIAHLWEEFKKRTNEGEDSKEAMDDLGLERYCCRSIFLGQVDTFKKF
jgi:DNA-directed RNA polymerase subunit N